jgi:hypothetical protein
MRIILVLSAKFVVGINAFLAIATFDVFSITNFIMLGLLILRFVFNLIIMRFNFIVTMFNFVFLATGLGGHLGVFKPREYIISEKNQNDL